MKNRSMTFFYKRLVFLTIYSMDKEGLHFSLQFVMLRKLQKETQ